MGNTVSGGTGPRTKTKSREGFVDVVKEEMDVVDDSWGNGRERKRKSFTSRFSCILLFLFLTLTQK